MSPGRHAEWAGNFVTRLLTVGAISWSSWRRRGRYADVERRTEPGDAGVHDHFGAELFDELDGSGELRRAFVAWNVGDRFGAHADDDVAADPLADVFGQRRRIERQLDVEPMTAANPASRRSTVAEKKFIEGEPMKAATNRLAGWS